VRNDVRQRGLPQSGRTEQQHMVERFAALPRRLDENRELLANFFLADILGESAWTQCALDDLFLHAGDLGADHAIELVVLDHPGILCLGEHFQRMPNAVADGEAVGSCFTAATASLSL
jgi:hypothetical protein